MVNGSVATYLGLKTFVSVKSTVADTIDARTKRPFLFGLVCSSFFNEFSTNITLPRPRSYTHKLIICYEKKKNRVIFIKRYIAMNH